METGRARIEEQMPEPPQPTPLPPTQFQAPPTEPLTVPPPLAQQPPPVMQPQEPPVPQQAQTAPVASEPAQASGAGNVEQIRDILFGAQMRDYERRFSNLEARLTQEAATLRDDIRARFDALELAMRQQFNALSESLGNERDNRTGAVQKVTDDVRVLRDDAADRRALASMFTEIARRLDAGSGSNGNNPPPDAQ